MKIAFLAGRLSARASGVREVAAHLSAALQLRGHDIRVFGLEDAAWNEGERDRWPGAPAIVGRPLWPRSLGYTPVWSQELAHFNPNVLHLHGLWLASAAIAAHWAKRSGKKLVVSPHGMLSEVALSYSPWRKRLVSWAYQDQCFRLTQLYHSTAASETAEIRAFGLTAPVAEIPIGVADMSPTLREAPPPRGRTVITLGRLHHKKRLDRLLRAWASLESDFPDWNLKIVGPDTPDGQKGKLQALAANLDLKRVGFPGSAFGDDKWRALQSAEIFVLPTDSENFALTVPEALLAELPVVSTDGAPWTMLPEQGIGWSVRRDEGALVGALAEAMQLTSEQRRAIGARGRAWALREFNWDVIASRMEAEYENVIRR